MQRFEQGALPREGHHTTSFLDQPIDSHLAIKNLGVRLQQNYARDTNASMDWLDKRKDTIKEGLFDPYCASGVAVPYKWEDAATIKGRLQNPQVANEHFKQHFLASELGQRIAAYPDRAVALEVEKIVRDIWRHNMETMSKIDAFEEFGYTGKQGISISQIAMHVAQDVKDNPVSVMSMMNKSGADEINNTARHALAQKLLLDYAAERLMDGPEAAVTMHAQHVVNTNTNALNAIHVVRACETMLPALREMHAQNNAKVPADLIYKVYSVGEAAAMSACGESSVEPHKFLEQALKASNEINAQKGMPLASVSDLKQAADFVQNHFPGVTQQYKNIAELQDSLGILNAERIEMAQAAAQAMQQQRDIANDNSIDTAAPKMEEQSSLSMSM